jgi:hypothetical protein
MNSVPDTVSQVRRALAPLGEVEGAEGVCFYSYSHFNKGQGLEPLRQALVDGGDAPFARPAALPTVPRLVSPAEGILAGRATGPDGDPLDSVRIPIEPAEGGPPVVCITDGNGHFAALGLSPGRYKLAVPYRGAALLQVVEVAAGKVTRVGD